MSAKHATFRPNSFHSPNDIVDKFLHLLTGDEVKCLIFAVRHILGWRDSFAEGGKKISLTSFSEGITYTNKEGETIKLHGTGLSRPLVKKAVDSLVNYGLLLKVGEPDNEGQYYRIPEEPDADWQAMETRRVKAIERGRKKIQKAAIASATKRIEMVGLTGTSHVPAGSTSHVPAGSTSHVPKEIPTGNTNTNTIKDSLQHPPSEDAANGTPEPKTPAIQEETPSTPHSGQPPSPPKPYVSNGKGKRHMTNHLGLPRCGQSLAVRKYHDDTNDDQQCQLCLNTLPLTPELELMAQRIGFVMGYWDEHTREYVTQKQQGKCEGTARNLNKKGIVADDINKFWRYWQTTDAWKKRQERPYSLETINNKIKAAAGKVGSVLPTGSGTASGKPKLTLLLVRRLALHHPLQRPGSTGLLDLYTLRDATSGEWLTEEKYHQHPAAKPEQWYPERHGLMTQAQVDAQLLRWHDQYGDPAKEFYNTEELDEYVARLSQLPKSA